MNDVRNELIAEAIEAQKNEELKALALEADALAFRDIPDAFAAREEYLCAICWNNALSRVKAFSGGKTHGGALGYLTASEVRDCLRYLGVRSAGGNRNA